MSFGLQTKHRDLGQDFTYDDRSGICDRVEIQPAIYRNIKTGKQTADKKIRLRLKPAQGRAFWTAWFPYRLPHPPRRRKEKDAMSRYKPTRMKAGYDGGQCEVCHDPIRAGDTYFFMPDEEGTVACEKCAASALPQPSGSRKGGAKS